MSGTSRDLKRRLKSITTTEQMTKAMKTVAVSKYNKTLTLIKSFEEHVRESQHLLAVLGGIKNLDDDWPPRKNDSVCYVLVTGSRGLCGMYNLELVRYAQSVIDGESRKVHLIICGKWGQENADTLCGAESVEFFDISDIPTYRQAAELFNRLAEIYKSKQADEVAFIVQKFKNVLVQTPTTIKFLPQMNSDEEETVSGDEYLFMPSKEALAQQLIEVSEDDIVYSILLDCALGFHGATLSAMRTAADNSAEMYEELSQTLNRMRQMAATTEVIELSGSNTAEQD